MATAPAESAVRNAALVVAALALATILGALSFQYFGGLKPCALCLDQRWAYYAGAPAAALAAWLATSAAGRAARALLALIALVFLANSALGVYHAGIEWHWWPGPQDCAGAGDDIGAGDLHDRLKNMRVTRCDEAAWRFFGLSLAGYNVLASGALAVIAAVGALQGRRGEA